MTPRAGEIYWTFIGAANDEHPAIVVSRAEFNSGDYLTVTPITHRKFERRSRLRNCVPFRAHQFGLKSDCVAQAENTTLVHKNDVNLDAGPLGELDGEAFRNMIRAIGHVLSAECEPM